MVEPVWITLTGVRAQGRHGVFDFERENGQEFVVDARIEVLQRIGPDELSGTVDYGALAEQIHRQITGEPVQLIETLAGRIADEVMEQAGVTAAEITVHKPHAPIGVEFGNVAVTVKRSNTR